MEKSELQERYKAVYGMAFNIAKKYHSRYPLPRSHSFFREVETSITDAYKADANFPIKFAQEMLNTVCKWFLNSFDGIFKDDIQKIFNTAWSWHKKYIGASFDDAKWDAALNESNKMCETLPDGSSGILVAALHEMDRANQMAEWIAETTVNTTADTTTTTGETT